MTNPETPEPTGEPEERLPSPEPAEPIPPPEPDADAQVEAEAEDEAPPPEPMTPEKVTAWNRYLDRYVAGGVLLLVLLATVRPIANSSLFPLLKAGELTGSRGPVTTDTFSYTMEGKRWVNIPWLYEFVNWQAFRIGSIASPNDASRALQIGGSILVAINALVLAIAAAVLLGVRRKGPGLWWAALCVMFALGGFVLPAATSAVRLAPAVGGLAAGNFQSGMASGNIEVDPETWGILLLCIELLLLHRAVNLGSRGALYGLPVLFLFWANLDGSFVFGLVILAAWLLGSLIRPPAQPKEGRRASWPLILGIVVGSVAICLVNPSTYHAFVEALDPYVKMVQQISGTRKAPLTYEMLTFVDGESQRFYDRQFGAGMSRAYLAFYLIVLWIGLMSFAINWRRFAPGRFLAFLAAALLWAGMVRLCSLFAPVFAAVLALNGQEWYLATFGTEGRLGARWKLWSDGGRAVTIVAIFAFLAIAITGYTGQPGELPFGLGVQTSRFAFETADYLRESSIEGRVLNFALAHGDALLWRDPNHRSFIDTREGLFPNELRMELRGLREALRDDDQATWAPILDRYGVSVLMVEPQDDVTVFESLLRSRNWAAIHDGGNAVLFGRLDKPGADRETFEARKLDAADRVYQQTASLPMPDRPPAPKGMIDQVMRGQSLTSGAPEVAAAARWLGGVWSGDEQAAADPARFFMAIREARAALAKDPDDPTAFLMLERAYALLTQAELAILQPGPSTTGSATTDAATPEVVALRSTSSQSSLFVRAPVTPPENLVDAFQVLQERFLGELMSLNEANAQAEQGPPITYLSYRYRQRVAALNYAIQTSPLPRGREQRTEMANLNLELADLYMGNQVLDLAADRLRAARELVGPAEFPEERQQTLDQLSEQVELIRSELDNMAEQDPQFASPIPRASQAAQAGLIGLAIEELRAAEGYGVSLSNVRPLLVDLYCRVGQPDEAFNLLEATQPGDPSLANTPGDGTAAYRQGMVYLLLGYYPNASVYWQNYAIPEVRTSQISRALAAGRGLLIGEPAGAVQSTLQLLGTPDSDGLVELQANWEAELGLALLEAGLPQDLKDDKGEVVQQGALSHLRKALELDPDIGIRPLLVYYVEKLGGEVPTKSEPGDETTTEPATEAPAPGSAEPKPDQPATPAEPKEGEATNAEPSAEETPDTGGDTDSEL